MEILRIGSKREELLTPLLQWKILGAQELAEISKYNGSDRNLRKMLFRAEKEGIIKSFIHKLSNRKYVYLSRHGHGELSSQNYNINEDIKMHDAIVGSVLYQFSKLELVTLSQINNQNIEFNQSIFSHGLDPDGMIRARKRDQIYNISIEIELTRKNSSEIFKKFNQYHTNTCYFWVIYFFSNMNILKAYSKYYEIYCEENKIELGQKMMMFCYSDNLANAQFNILNSYWLRPDGVESRLHRLFS